MTNEIVFASGKFIITARKRSLGQGNIFTACLSTGGSLYDIT